MGWIDGNKHCLTCIVSGCRLFGYVHSISGFWYFNILLMIINISLKTTWTMASRDSKTYPASKSSNGSVSGWQKEKIKKNKSRDGKEDGTRVRSRGDSSGTEAHRTVDSPNSSSKSSGSSKSPSAKKHMLKYFIHEVRELRRQIDPDAKPARRSRTETEKQMSGYLEPDVVCLILSQMEQYLRHPDSGLLQKKQERWYVKLQTETLWWRRLIQNNRHIPHTRQEILVTVHNVKEDYCPKFLWRETAAGMEVIRQWVVPF